MIGVLVSQQDGGETSGVNPDSGHPLFQLFTGETGVQKHLVGAAPNHYGVAGTARTQHRNPHGRRPEIHAELHERKVSQGGRKRDRLM